MDAGDTVSAQYARDLEQTRANRERLLRNGNLLHWYRELYCQVFGGVPDLAGKAILEIGSGTSPLKLFYPQVVTSDVLRLDYLDHVFDCHDIDQYAGIADHSVDVMSLTNVLHHLRDPIEFLRKATTKLKPGGEVMLVEPFVSAVSYPLYKLLHHEPLAMSAARPGLDHVEGPLASANQAIPYLIFRSRPEWLAALSGHYDTRAMRVEFFTSLSYMATGGISRRFPVPGWLYRSLFGVDRALARLAPRLFASFFIVRLTARGGA